MTEHLDDEGQSAKIKKLLALLPASQREETADVLENNAVRSLQLLTDIIYREHTNRRTCAILMAVPGALMFLGTLLSLTQTNLPEYVHLAGISGMVLLLLSPLTRIPTTLEKAAVEAIVLRGDKRSIGALLETLQISHLPPALHQRSRQRMTHLLQNLTEADANLLTSVQRSQLCRNLNYLYRDHDLELRLATLKALQNVGDPYCLGVIYTLAEGDAATHTAQMVRQAACDCIEQIGGHLDFGSVTQIPDYTDSLVHQMQSEIEDHQITATCLLALRHLLPQLQPTHYQSVLSERHRDRLYQLLTLPFIVNQNRYGIHEVQKEILRTAHRLADTRALPSVRKIAFGQIPHPAAKQFRALARETLTLLEAQAEREKESKTLLRGASEPTPLAQELLRAASSAPLATLPGELLRASCPHTERASILTDLPSDESEIALIRPTQAHRP